MKTIILGFCIAAPVGPIGVICVRNTLNNGYKSGLVTGLGAATADAVFASIVAFGLLIIGNTLTHHRTIIQLFGVILLCYLGIRIYFSKHESINNKREPFTKTFLITFFLTLTNPMTILSFLAIYSSLGFIDYNTTALLSFIFVLGVFIGSNLWWLILSTGLSLFRLKVYKKIVWVNRLSGVIIIVFALWIFKNILHEF